MSRSKKVLGRIARDMPGVVMCKDMMVLRPTGHILRAYFLDTTIERDLVFLWRLVLPLYSPLRGYFHNSSKRIPDDQKIYIDRNDHAESARRVRAIIDSDIETPRSIRHAHDFLHQNSWMLRNTNPLCVFNLALTHGQIGNFDKSHELIRGLAAEIAVMPDNDSRRDYMAPFVTRASRAIEAGRDEFTALMDEWKEENVAKFELQKALVGLSSFSLVS